MDEKSIGGAVVVQSGRSRSRGRVTDKPHRYTSSNKHRSRTNVNKHNNNNNADDPAAEQEDGDILPSLVEDTDKQFGPAIKVVVDRGLESSFEKSLSRHVRKKNADIKNICSDHYEEFIASIDNLLTVQEDITQLGMKMTHLNSQVQKSGQELIKKSEELIHYRTLSFHVAQALNLLGNCQYIINLSIRAMDQINNGKYFSALRTLDSLQRNQLQKYSEFEFVKHLESQIPVMLFSIRQNVKAQFDQWLQQVQIASEDLGALAMVQVSEQLAAEEKKEKRRRMKRLEENIDRRAAATMKSMDDVLDSGIGDGATAEVELFDKFNIEFSAVYQCLHIYENLNIADKFVQVYKESRRNQCSHLVEPRKLQGDDFIEVFHSYFAALAGFFIVEDAVLRSGNDLLTKPEIDELWEMAVGRIKVLLTEQLSYMNEAENFLKVKETVVLFAKTLESFQLKVEPLMAFLASHRDKYEELLIHRFRADVGSIVHEEKFEPLIVSSMKDYEKYVLAYQLQDEEKKGDYKEEEKTPAAAFETIMSEGDGVENLEEEKFPRMTENLVFPKICAFSITVPKICRAVKRFVHDYYVFARNLPSMDKQIRKAVDEILEKEVDAFMNSIIDNSPSLNISQAVQIAINSNYLVIACSYFEKYASSFMSAKSMMELDEDNLKLKVRRVFTRTMDRSQNLIFELMNSKIEGFLVSLAGNIDWTPSKILRNPSGFVQDLIAYLDTTSIVLEFLPLHIKQGIQFTSFRHINLILMNGLLETKKYNILYIVNLNVDLKALEEFARRQPTAGLVSCFSELRQFIDLMLSGNVEQILDKPTRDAKFPHLSNEKLVVLLDRFKDLGMMQSVPSDIPKLKRSNFNPIIKRLKH